MKVLFLSRLFYPHVGGVEKHLKKISEVLLKKGCQISIITTRFDSSLRSFEDYEGLSIFRFRQPKIKYLGLLLTWTWFLKNHKLIKENDLIHIHDVFIWYLPFKILFPRKKVFITFHGSWGKYPIPLIDLWQKKLGRLLANGVLSIGDYIPANYGFKSDFISYGATDLPAKKVKKDKKLIVYVGRLDKNTALEKYFAAFSVLKDDFKIVFCGDGELKNECEKYGKVLGFIDPQPYFEKASYSFASGYLSIIEALVNKCLVFTSYKNSLQKDYYYPSPFINFITVKERPEDLLGSFQYFQTHSKEKEKMIKNGFLWAKNQTWEKMVERYQDLWAG